MDLSDTRSRVNRSRESRSNKNKKASKNLAGRPRGNVINSPKDRHRNTPKNNHFNWTIPRKSGGNKRGKAIESSRGHEKLDDIYEDDSPSRGRESPNDHNWNAKNDGYDSSGERFSNDGDEDDNRTRLRETNKKSEQKVEKKRQHQKDMLAKMQREKDESKVINVDHEHEGANPPRCFDEVPIDKFHNPDIGKKVHNLVEELGSSHDVAEIVSRVKPCDRKHLRGKHHEKSSLVRSLSPSTGNVRILNRDRVLHGDGKLRKRTGQHNHGRHHHSPDHHESRVLNSHKEDPLDIAKSLQESNRRSPSFFAPILRHEVSKGKSKRGKKSDTKGSLENGRNQKRTSSAFFSQNASTVSHRERRAEAAILRQTANENHMGQPLSGEKRKAEHRSERREDEDLLKKKQFCPKGSPDNAIDVDESHTMLDDSVQFVDSPPSLENNSDRDIDDVAAAIEASSKPVAPEDYDHLTPAKSDTGPSVWEEGNANMGTDFGIKRCPVSSGSKGQSSSGKKAISDINGYLKGTKKNDDIASSPDLKDGLRDKEVNSTANNSTVKSLPKLPRRKREYGKSGKEKSNGFGAKLKRSGQLQDHEGDDGWYTRNQTPNSQKSKPAGRTTARRQSRSSIINYTSRQTRSKSRTRSTPKSTRSENDIITIDSSSEEEDEVSIDDADENILESVAEGRPRRKRAAGDRPSIDAVRIAVGKKVFKRKCELSVQPGTNNPYILFSYFDEKGKSFKHYVYLKEEELKELRYFIARDDENEDSLKDDSVEPMTVIAFRITPTEKNNFSNYSNAYDQEDTENAENYKKRFISVEVRDTDEFQAMLVQMRQHPALDVWCSEHSEISFDDLAKYTHALQEENRKERDMRQSIANRTRSGGKGNKKKKDSENKLLLVYPFDVNDATLAEAASGLKELGGDTLGILRTHDDGEQMDVDIMDQPKGGGNRDEGGKSSTRTHYITIREDDKERLCPGQFLNDSLVDFWMRWISRGESQTEDSNVHFFTSHFMTTLKDEGPEAVSSWTAKKNINVFKKKLIFVPVNANLHWSLCVIVNPGLIARYHTGEEDGIPESEDHSCILFLDSLKMHSKNTYARHIRKWLNCEWKRLEKGTVSGKITPFSNESIPLCSPKIPYQENGCDCGVFVCRYAYNLFLMRHQKFTWDDIEEKPTFKTLITKGPAFQFDMSDIARIREEIGVLIDNLSKHYLRMKQQEKANRRAKRKGVESSKAGNEDATSENTSEEATSAASGKEYAPSETTGATSEDDGYGAVLDKHEVHKIMSAYDGKENVSQQELRDNSVCISDDGKKTNAGDESGGDIISDDL